MLVVCEDRSKEEIIPSLSSPTESSSHFKIVFTSLAFGRIFIFISKEFSVLIHLVVLFSTLIYIFSPPFMLLVYGDTNPDLVVSSASSLERWYETVKSSEDWFSPKMVAFWLSKSIVSIKPLESLPSELSSQ